MAVMRMQLNRKEVSRLQNKFAYDIYPVKGGDRQKTFEYALVLQIKLMRNELVDFVRGITPISIDLLYVIMKKYCGFDINNFTAIKKGVRKWDKKKVLASEIQTILETGYGDPFKYGMVSSTHIEKIISAFCTDEMIKDKVSKMVLVEGKIRNKAAHEIVSVTDEWMYKETGITANELMEIIRYLCGKADIVVGKASWDSYKQFNDDIIKLID